MKSRNNIPTNILRRLYAHSGNRCAFEGCCCPIFEEDGTLTGECCHIEAYSPNGPRYNAHQTNEEKHGYDNLILMCARHHIVIDSNPELYTVEKLKTLKNAHETQYKAQQMELTNLMLKQLQWESDKYWRSLQQIDESDNTGFKMKLTENDIDTLMKDIESRYDALQSLINSIYGSLNNLEGDFKKECLKCGIDYSLFDKIPYYENSLKNRDWEIINIGFPNVISKLKIDFLQLFVIMLEKIIKSGKSEREIQLLDIYKKKLKTAHKEAYYFD